MKAIIIPVFGDPDVLSVADVPEPVLRQGDLLVQTRAVGVNRADLNQRRGAYGREYFGDSDIMGLEIAGDVIAVAPDVTLFQPGDRVMGIVGGGGYAELARIPECMAMPIPATLSYEEAAAIPEAFVTAHEALFHSGRLCAVETLLLHGAAGGIGTAAMALARQSGAKLLVTARSSVLPDLMAIGADLAIDYREDFLPLVLDATDGRGVDVIIDVVGAPNLQRNVLALGDGGRLIQLGLIGGRDAALLPMDRLLFRRLTLAGSIMKSRSLADKAAMSRRFADRWLSDFAKGTLRATIHRTFPLVRARDAHAAMEAGGHLGKFVLVP